MALLVVAGAVGAATSPIYVSDSPVIAPPDIAPQIDATAFVNRSTFSVSSALLITPLPYETDNTLFFTNTGSGVMFGDPGYRFRHSTANLRTPMDTWVNQGSISAGSSLFLISGANVNWLLVEATNIISTGPLSVGSQGLVRLHGRNIDIRRNGLRSGQFQTNTGFIFGSSAGASNYINDVGIIDFYWGEGTNNTIDGSGNTMVLNGGGGLDDLSYTLPFPQSPYHEVIQDFGLGSRFTNLVTVPFFSFGGNYDAVAYTNQLGPTNFAVQVIFYPTNSFDSNYFRAARFYPEFDGGATAVVGFQSSDFDIVAQTFITNAVFLVDVLAFETNVFLARNLNTTATRRPNTYAVTRNMPFEFDPAFGAIPGNTAYNPSLLYNPATYLSNRVQILYTGYSVNVSSINTPGTTIIGSPLTNPTNFPGRVEIVGNNVNLDQSRVRADTTFILRAQNVTSNRLAQVDAPFVIFDVGTVEPVLVVSNIAPAFVRRLNGSIAAWSGTWRNYEVTGGATNAIDFHVLIVEDSLQPLQSVIVNEFRVRGNHIIISDIISVGSALEIDSRSLDISGQLGLPFGSSWGATNVHNLLSFTNRNVLNIDGSAYFGADRTNAYENFVNWGTVSSASQFLRTENFDNSGTMIANGGLLSVSALDAKLTGGPTLIFTNVFTNIFFGFTNVVTNIVTNSIGATLAGNGDIELNVAELVVSNSIISAGFSSTPGGLVLNATNRLVDAGPGAPNHWTVKAGFVSRIRPAVSDLLGTRIRSIALPFAEVFSSWAALDLGPVTDGYRNNLALGRLTLDAQNPFSLFRFVNNQPGRALYVDYLDFQNYATNINQAIAIDPNTTLYFADSNLEAEKLDGALGGRLRWVPWFAGPLSSTNLTYPSGQEVTLNRALVASRDRDDDNDGIVNAEDPDPILVPVLTVTVSTAPSRSAILTWDSVAAYTNRVQFKTSLTQVGWMEMTSIVNGPVNTQLQVVDPVPAGAPEKYYRVRVDAP